MILSIVDRSHYTIDILLSLFISVFCWVCFSSPSPPSHFLFFIFPPFLLVGTEILPHGLAASSSQSARCGAVAGEAGWSCSRRRISVSRGRPQRGHQPHHCGQRGTRNNSWSKQVQRTQRRSPCIMLVCFLLLLFSSFIASPHTLSFIPSVPPVPPVSPVPLLATHDNLQALRLAPELLELNILSMFLGCAPLAN